MLTAVAYKQPSETPPRSLAKAKRILTWDLSSGRSSQR
jgi:hypothetical protein